MNIQNRPLSVPEDAIWNAKDKFWELGTLSNPKNKKSPPIGEWKYWREDGSLACIASFDKDGNQHGSCICYHPDGTIASTGEWKHGSRNGHFIFIRSKSKSNETYPASSATWRYEFDSYANWEEKNEKWYLEDGTECTSDGRALTRAFDLEKIFENLEPEEFLEKSAEKVYKSFHKSKKKKARQNPEDDSFANLLIWGTYLEELDHFNKFCVSGAGFEKSLYPRKFEQNIWRELISNPYDNCFEELAAIFVGAVKIGTINDSEGVYVTLFHPLRKQARKNTVYIWSHETYYLDQVISIDLDHFAFQMALQSAYASERISKDTACKAFNKLANRVDVSYLGSSVYEELKDYIENKDDASFSLDKESFQLDLDPDHYTRVNFWKNQWIIHLLSNPQSKSDWENLESVFNNKLNRAFNEEEFEEFKNFGIESPHFAIYLLWRHFWFDEQKELKDCMHFYEHHRAPIVRDLVILFQEIFNGKTEIGPISNIFDLRTKFLHLELSPKHELNRVEKEQESNKIIETKKIADLTRAKNVCAEDLQSILNKAWYELENTFFVQELENGARKISISELGEEQEILWWTLDWLRAQKFVRDDLTIEEEAYTASLWLAAKNLDTILPFVVSDIFKHEITAAGFILPLYVSKQKELNAYINSFCLRLFSIDDEYQQNKELALRIMESRITSEFLEPIFNSINEFLDQVKLVSGHEARLVLIPWEAYLRKACECISKLSPTQNLPKDKVLKLLNELMNVLLEIHDYNTCSYVIDALLAWGEYNLLPQVASLLRSSDDKAQITALKTIESFAVKFDSEARRKFLILEFLNPDDSDRAITLYYLRAHIALSKLEPDISENISIEEALSQCQEIYLYGLETKNAWEICLCDTAFKYEEIRIENIEPLLYSYKLSIREAAERVYLVRGLKIPSRTSLCAPEIHLVLNKVNDKKEQAKLVCQEISKQNSIDISYACGWLWQNASEFSADFIAEFSKKHLQKLYLANENEANIVKELDLESQWIFRALAAHGKFEVCKAVLNEILCSFENSRFNKLVVAEIISQVNMLTSDFANILFSIAKEEGAWQAYKIATWALEHESEPELKKAMDNHKLNSKKLKNWLS